MSRGEVSDGERFAEQVRSLVLHTVAHDADADATVALAELAESLADAMEENISRTLSAEAVGGPSVHPVSGVGNPIAAPLVDTVDGNQAVAAGTYTVTHEGPPGCVHGGAIAAGFEHVVERSETLFGVPPTFTHVGPGSREVRIQYRRPTLLDLPLRFEADPPIDTGSGSMTIEARLLQVGEVTCEATAVWTPDTPFGPIGDGDATDIEAQ
ncbi:MAG TPA: hypothetical protein DCR10_10965 [Acidimicrobiaceae bacterium]|nr:hypothetical protein [Acidimicrobiaceae bacterium]